MPIHDQPTQVISTVLDEQAPYPAPEPVEERRGGSRIAGLLRLLLFVLVIVPLGLVAAALLVTPPRENVLILGSDARPDELRQGAIGRTDTLMLLVADRATPKVGLVSVPRDLWVPIPGYGEERINAACELGGAQTAKQTVSNVLGATVDRYVLIGLQGVRGVVDAIGGVDITVDEPIYDPAYPTDDYGTVEVRIPAGRQHMDGETALRYARTRHQDSDFGRIARQQRVLSAVRTAMMNPANWPRMPAVLAEIQQATRTDVSVLDAIAIGAAFLRDPGEPDRLVVDTSLVDPIVGQGGAYLLTPKPTLRPTVARFLGRQPAAVEVLNGAGVAGIARRTADRLTASGFEVARVGDASQPVPASTILVRPESRRAGEVVATVLGLSARQVQESSALPEGVDVRLTIGPDLAN